MVNPAALPENCEPPVPLIDDKDEHMANTRYSLCIGKVVFVSLSQADEIWLPMDAHTVGNGRTFIPATYFDFMIPGNFLDIFMISNSLSIVVDPDTPYFFFFGSFSLSCYLYSLAF